MGAVATTLELLLEAACADDGGGGGGGGGGGIEGALEPPLVMKMCYGRSQRRVSVTTTNAEKY